MDDPLVDEGEHALAVTFVVCPEVLVNGFPAGECLDKRYVQSSQIFQHLRPRAALKGYAWVLLPGLLVAVRCPLSLGLYESWECGPVGLLGSFRL